MHVIMGPRPLKSKPPTSSTSKQGEKQTREGSNSLPQMRCLAEPKFDKVAG